MTTQTTLTTHLRERVAGVLGRIDLTITAPGQPLTPDSTVLLHPADPAFVDYLTRRLAIAFQAGVIGEAIAILPAAWDPAILRPYPRCQFAGQPLVAYYLGWNLPQFADQFAGLGDVYARVQ